MASVSGADGGCKSTEAASEAARPSVFGHAFHHNLPEHCVGPDGIPYVTRYAEMKSRSVLKLARSMVLTERAFLDAGSYDDLEVDDTAGADSSMSAPDDDDFVEKAPTMVCFIHTYKVIVPCPVVSYAYDLL